VRFSNKRAGAGSVRATFARLRNLNFSAPTAALDAASAAVNVKHAGELEEA
jgi:hypothetical protein